MDITKLNQAPKVSFNLDGHIMANHADVEIIHLHLKPGEKVDKHTNPFDVIFYVLEGKAMLESRIERFLVLKDQSIVIKAGITLGWTISRLGTLSCWWLNFTIQRSSTLSPLSCCTYSFAATSNSKTGKFRCRVFIASQGIFHLYLIT